MHALLLGKRLSYFMRKKKRSWKQTSRIRRQLNQRKANWRNSSPCSSIWLETGSGGTQNSVSDSIW